MSERFKIIIIVILLYFFIVILISRYYLCEILYLQYSVKKNLSSLTPWSYFIMGSLKFLQISDSLVYLIPCKICVGITVEECEKNHPFERSTFDSYLEQTVVSTTVKDY